MSILLSCLIFVHPLGLQQWAATLVIFCALYAEAFSKGPSAPKEVAAPEEMYSLKAEEGMNTENEKNIPAMYVKEGETLH